MLIKRIILIAFLLFMLSSTHIENNKNDFDILETTYTKYLDTIRCFDTTQKIIFNPEIPVDMLKKEVSKIFNKLSVDGDTFAIFNYHEGSSSASYYDKKRRIIEGYPENFFCMTLNTNSAQKSKIYTCNITTKIKKLSEETEFCSPCKVHKIAYRFILSSSEHIDASIMAQCINKQTCFVKLPNTFSGYGLYWMMVTVFINVKGTPVYLHTNIINSGVNTSDSY